MKTLLTDARCSECGRETLAPGTLDDRILDISCWLDLSGEAPMEVAP